MKINYCGAKMQRDMISRGWQLKLQKEHETNEQFYERLSQSYNKVKIYYVTTSVRGFYNYIAFVKDRRES